MNKKVYGGLYIIFTLLIASSMTMPVSAHTIKTDGEIRALLHINPNDAPTSGTTSSLNLTFQDSSNRLNLNNCNCSITIQEDGHIIKTEPLAIKDLIHSANSYIFPKSDVYTLKVTGQPTETNVFQPFVLSYTVRVEKGTNEASSNRFSILIWICLGLLIGFVILLAMYQERSYKRRHKKG